MLIRYVAIDLPGADKLGLFAYYCAYLEIAGM